MDSLHLTKTVERLYTANVLDGEGTGGTGRFRPICSQVASTLLAEGVRIYLSL